MTAPIEARIADALRAAGSHVEPNPDLFARVSRSVDADRARRRWRRRMATRALVYAAVLTAVGAAGSDYRQGSVLMPWWLLHLLTTVVLLTIAVVLGPFIKRFGRSYAADVFRANPRTGKSYLVLTDIAYYLIFVSYILFTLQFEAQRDWSDDANAAQMRFEVARVGGILLILGLLHAANIVMLPMIGRVLSLNRKLDEEEFGTATGAVAGGAAPTAPAPGPIVTGTSLAAGAWVLRIEPVTSAAPGDAPTQSTDE
jgi:hypothetical protein